MTSADSAPLVQLLSLSHELGREDRRLAILGEGNTSMRVDEDTFLVKASGSRLGTLNEEGVTACRMSRLLPLLDLAELDDDDVDAALMESRVDGAARKPSVEAMFHAWLLTLPGVRFVGHTHPVAVNAILCSPRAEDFATRRIFPDEVVCCGPASPLVPYTDPGLPLAREIRTAVQQHQETFGEPPRTVLLRNHGLIAVGNTAAAVLAATLMTTKAAEIFLGASALGGPVFLAADQVARIGGRRDEHYRQKALGLRT
jgi:rhamnose utilization protein RhaD (predicted bifunctional aldolase and dehydrogenase)